VEPTCRVSQMRMVWSALAAANTVASVGDHCRSSTDGLSENPLPAGACVPTSAPHGEGDPVGGLVRETQWEDW
jgi:hypothetical protein